MKKADPLCSIPPVPKSLAGQWLAFSHMANHYRKLFNVKPRVDSCAPRRSTMTMTTPSIYNYIEEATTVVKPNQRRRQDSINQININGSLSCLANTNTNTSMGIEKGCQTKGSPKPKPKSVKNKNNLKVKEQQSNFLFGPSSLKSSSDALMTSESESSQSQPDEPRVETMGVAEKIRAFLDNLHNPTKSKPKQKVPSPSTVCSHFPDKKDEVKNPRHARCFTPSTTPKTSRKAVNPLLRSSATTLTQKPQQMKLSDAISQVGRNKKKHATTSTPIDRFGESRKERHFSGGSLGSIGTIRGSEELAMDDDALLSPIRLELEASVPIVASHSKLKNRKSRTRTPSAGYWSQSNKATTTSLSSTGGTQTVPMNNKDSSRDSAYGFSSGDSRFTTRDSTPEKLARASKSLKGKAKRASDRRNKASLSTVASSVNLDADKKESKICSSHSEEKYLDFLTEVTEDIVSRGIYTNRGLKILFKEHLSRRKHELNTGKMKKMLDKLRMDLGIPKDDSLNRLDFGYGSVLKNSSAHIPDTVRKSIRGKSGGLDETFSDEFVATPTPYPSRNTLPIDRKDTGSDADASCKSDDTSLSENELRQTLQEVGIDDGTALEIVNLIKGTSAGPAFTKQNLVPELESGDGQSQSDKSESSDDHETVRMVHAQPFPSGSQSSS